MSWDVLDSFSQKGSEISFFKFNPNSVTTVKFLGAPHLSYQFFDDKKRHVLTEAEAAKDDRAKEVLHALVYLVSESRIVVMELKPGIANELREWRNANGIAPSDDAAPQFTLRVSQPGDWKTRRYSLTPLMKGLPSDKLAEIKQDLPDIAKFFKPDSEKGDDKTSGDTALPDDVKQWLNS